jgi:hypothetical protein
MRSLKKQTFIGTYFDLHTRTTHPVFGDPDDVPWRKPMEVEQEREVLDQMFKFKVGDVVRHIAQGPELKGKGHETWRYTRSDDVRYFILERFVQQCYGGIQKHYKVRLVKQAMAFPDKENVLLLENEIQISEPFTVESEEKKETPVV